MRSVPLWLFGGSEDPVRSGEEWRSDARYK
jgi:hypothetical protein